MAMPSGLCSSEEEQTYVTLNTGTDGTTAFNCQERRAQLHQGPGRNIEKENYLNYKSLAYSQQVQTKNSPVDTQAAQEHLKNTDEPFQMIFDQASEGSTRRFQESDVQSLILGQFDLWF